MTPRIVIAAYKPKLGKDEAVRHLALSHYLRLKNEDLVTDRKPILMQALDGTVIEVFEWKSSEAIEKAHTNKVVGQMWTEFSEVCDYIPIGQLPESINLFAEYLPIN
jgi:hypothetical protein